MKLLLLGFFLLCGLSVAFGFDLQRDCGEHGIYNPLSKECACMPQYYGEDCMKLRVEPILHCVRDEEQTPGVPGPFTVSFGYINPHPEPVNIPRGPDNELIGGNGIAQPQPESFEHGMKKPAFSVTYAGGRLCWALTGIELCVTEESWPACERECSSYDTCSDCIHKAGDVCGWCSGEDCVPEATPLEHTTNQARELDTDLMPIHDFLIGGGPGACVPRKGMHPRHPEDCGESCDWHNLVCPIEKELEPCGQYSTCSACLECKHPPCGWCMDPATLDGECLESLGFRPHGRVCAEPNLWFGFQCPILIPVPVCEPGCGLHGTCVPHCECDPGWEGELCDQAAVVPRVRCIEAIMETYDYLAVFEYTSTAAVPFDIPLGDSNKVDGSSVLPPVSFLPGTNDAMEIPFNEGSEPTWTLGGVSVTPQLWVDEFCTDPCEMYDDCVACIFTAHFDCGWCDYTRLCMTEQPDVGCEDEDFYTDECPVDLDPCAAYDTCEHCAQHPECGWCETKLACQSERDCCPHIDWYDEGLCPVPPDPCADILFCQECTADVNCGWCGPELNGDCRGEIGDCPNTAEIPWNTEVCPIEAADECAAIDNCALCSANEACGWCAADCTCHAGSGEGPTAVGACPQLDYGTWFYDTCPGLPPMDEFCLGLSERQVLEMLYASTNGPSWTSGNEPGDSQWLAGDDACAWYGVECHGPHVNFINLQRNNLDGVIPQELGCLRHLKGLNLYVNSLKGCLPASLGDLHTSLQIVALSHNQLTCEVPESWTSLKHVMYMYLDHNQIGCTLPPAVDNIRFLREWHSEHNVLQGEIPPNFALLTHLEELHLYCNPDLTEPVPNFLNGLGILAPPLDTSCDE